MDYQMQNDFLNKNDVHIPTIDLCASFNSNNRLDNAFFFKQKVNCRLVYGNQ